MTRKRRPATGPPPDTAQVARLAAAVTAFGPGARAYWRNPEDGQTHPVTVKFPCCEASDTPSPMYQVVDEFGWGHLAYETQLRPRVDGGDYQSRPAGPRKGETT